MLTNVPNQSTLRCLTVILFVFALGISGVQAGNQPPTKPDTDCNESTEKARINSILDKLGQTTAKIKTLEADIRYLFIQDPELLDAQTLRKGALYYKKSDTESKIRFNFETQQQDDFDEEIRPEYYLFDGVWLTKVDFALKKIDMYQQAPVDKPMEVFEFISHNFPIVGFTAPDKLDKEFDISIVEDDETSKNHPIQLLLKVKKTSIYKDEYTKIHFYIDKKRFLPIRLVSYSKQSDVYDITFLNVKLNKKLKNGVFTIETLKDFSKNIEPLKKNKSTVKGD